MITKIVNAQLYISDVAGNLRMRIADKVQFGSYSESLNIFVVTDLDGDVMTYDTSGNPIRKIRVDKDAIEARFVGDDILIRTRKGENMMYDISGNIRRVL